MVRKWSKKYREKLELSRFETLISEGFSSEESDLMSKRRISASFIRNMRRRRKRILKRVTGELPDLSKIERFDETIRRASEKNDLYPFAS